MPATTTPRPLHEVTKLSYEDYALIPEDGRRHEIINGVEIVSPAPRTRHQRLVGRLFVLLDAHVRRHSLGEVFVAPFDVLLSDHDIVQPDVLFVSDARLDIVDEANCKGAPDLVCEVLSEGTRRTDLLRKRQLYGRAGVAEYWALDPAVDAVQVFRPGTDGPFERAAEPSAEGGEALTSPLLPGLALDLEALFT
jgi:Uma2 family endonuclease